MPRVLVAAVKPMERAVGTRINSFESHFTTGV